MSTTGTGTGSDFSGLNDWLKQVYTDAFENTVEADQEVLDLIAAADEGSFQIVEGPDGKQINLAHVFSSGGGVGAMLEDDYFYTSTNPVTKQSAITIKQLSATAELSGRVFRRVKGDKAAFSAWADEALTRKARRLAFHKDRMALGTGTGIIARVNDASPATTNTPIDAAFGIAGLEGAIKLLLEQDSTRWSPNADGTSPRTGAAVISSLDYPNSEIDIVALPTSGADNDYIFLGDANTYGLGAREMMGLEGIVDDGTNVATIQGLARATYPKLNAQIIDASSASLGFGQVLSEELVDYADELAFERGNGGKPNVLLCSRSGARSYWKALKADRVINDPAGSAGKYEGGKGDLFVRCGARVIRLRVARKVPSSRAYFLDTTPMRRFKNGSGRWDDTPGSVWQRVTDGTGRKDAYYAVYIEEEELGCGDFARSVKFTNLAAA